MRILSKTTAFVATSLLMAGAAHAADPAYVGKWGADAAQCKQSQETNKAPMIVKKSGYDSHETHCTFSDIKKSGSSWTVKSTCSVEGDKQVDKLTLSVKGNTLMFGWAGEKPWKFQRCG